MLQRKDIFKNMVVTEGLNEVILEQDPEGEEEGVSWVPGVGAARVPLSGADGRGERVEARQSW